MTINNLESVTSSLRKAFQEIISPDSIQGNHSGSHFNHTTILSIILPSLLKRETDQVNEEQNQIQRFTELQAFVQRVSATSSSCASIAAVLVAMYFFLAIDPKRLVFRHHLIFFLLAFDLIKACVLLLYPTRVLTHSAAYYNRKFCQVVGYFTAVSIEGADIAILAFAVHTYLLIFKPSLNTRVHNSNRIEGGLYKFRFYVYLLSFIVPLILASLAFINGTGYSSLVCWCYLPMRPVWYRLVLSWVPRYCIVVSILVIYGFIYFHVIKEFKNLSGLFAKLHVHRSRSDSVEEHQKRYDLTFFSSFKFFYQSIKSYIVPTMSVEEKKFETEMEEEDDDDDVDQHQSIISMNDDLEDTTSTEYTESSPVPKSPINNENANLNEHNLINFKKRQRIIQKQMKSIFVYPFAYCFIWLFPFILQVTQINYEEHHGPIYWLNVLGAFMQPFNGFVDSMVFFYRERPWNYTIMRNFEKEHKQRMNNIIVNDLEHRASETQESIVTMATSARIAKNSLSASSGLIDIEKYPWWRRLLNKLHIPLFKLPTEQNIIHFQNKYIDKRLIKKPQKLHSKKDITIPIGITEKYNPVSAGTNHDYSGFISGDLGDGAPGFKSNFNKFSFRNNSIAVMSRKSSAAINIKRPSEVGDPKTNNQTRQENGNEEIDFLEFLQKGP